MNDENETTDADWQELDAGEDVTDGEPMQGDGEEVEEVASDVDAAIYLAQQEAARDAFFGQQPQYQRTDAQQQQQPGYAPPGYESQQQPQGYAPPAGAPPEYFAPFEPPAEPAYPPQPGAPFGADENGIPYLPPNNPSPNGPPGSKPFDYSNLGNFLKNHPLIFPPGPESYDGQWRIATMWMAPDPAEYTANGYVLETSTNQAGPGRLLFPSWRLVLDSQSSSDTPEAEPPRQGTHTGPGMFGDLDAAFAGLRIGAPARAPVALVRPTSSASTPRSAPSAPKAPTSSKPGTPRPSFVVTAPRTKPLPTRPTSRGPALPAVPLAVRRAPITTVVKTPGLAKAILRLPNGAKGTKIQIRPLPRGSVALKTPANAYDGRWHDATKEKPPSSPRANMRLVQRSSAAGAVWRFIPRLRPGAAAAALRPGVRPALRPGVRPRISGMDPNDPRENITGNPAGSSSGLTPAGAMLVPVSFLTDVQRSRQPAIIGGCACVRSSEMDDTQRQRVGDFWGDFSRGFSTVDHAIDQGWQVARPFVPYGDTIDAVHRARMGLMYGDQGAGAARGAADEAISSAQSLTRRARKGDAAAQAQLVQLKEAAARGDANAIRTWRVVVLVSRDDDARIANGDAPSSSASSSAPSSSANPLGSLLSSVARR